MSGAVRIKQLAGIMELPGFPKSSGMRVVSAEPGKVTMALKKRPELTQFFGHPLRRRFHLTNCRCNDDRPAGRFGESLQRRHVHGA